MKSFTVILTSLLLASPALAQTHRGGPCLSPGDKFGVCAEEGQCKKYGGSWTIGHCPGAGGTVRCCSVSPCGPKHGGIGWASMCKWTKQGCSGRGGSYWGKDECPGGNNFKCCHWSSKPLPPLMRRAFEETD